MADGLIRTTCPYCGVGCGVTVASGGTEPVAGDVAHPANLGRLCVKGSALHETLSLKRRLLHPHIDGRRVGWDDALDTLVSRLRETIASRGPRSAALYLSGQMLTEDYYVANKLWKGFVGSANVDTNSRLCMSSAVAAQQRAFGEDVVPGCYEDLELADLVILVGSNAAWAHPVLYQRLLQARRQRPGMKLVVIDPRRTESCDQADLHLPLKPGADAFLFNGLLSFLAHNHAVDHDYVRAHTHGFSEALSAARASSPSVAETARLCELDIASVRQFFSWFAQRPRTVTMYSQGINQSSSGTDKANAIINCHLATGRIGKPGASPFSITGQPNAMGGREVGGLANQLAVHRGFDEKAVAAVRKFWNAPSIATAPGLKAVELFEAVESGKITFLWIIATNPLVSMPDAERWRRALQRCPTVVVSDCTQFTDTTACADILLPAAGWGEKNGTVTNSERRLSRQRDFLPLPGEARPDWWILSEVGRRFGFEQAFRFNSAHEVFVEHAALSGINAGTPLQFDISALATLGAAQYDAMEPTQWPLPGTGERSRERLFSDGHFSTADGRAFFISVSPQWPRARIDTNKPFLLNTGRVRDQWHTMTRSAESERLNQHRSEPYLDLHPADAETYTLAEGDIVEVSNERGQLLLRARFDAGQQRGCVFAPIHWSDQFAARAKVDVLVEPVTDPHSGQPELKQSPVALRRWPVRWQALLVCRQGLSLDRGDYWAGFPIEGGWLYRLAGIDSPPLARDRMLALLPGDADMHFADENTGELRCAWTHDGQLEAVFLMGKTMPDVDLTWVTRKLGCTIEPEERRILLSGYPAGARENTGALICSCFQVGEIPIRAAIAAGCASSEALGLSLKCGTNCGSCVPELNRLIRENARIAATSG